MREVVDDVSHTSPLSLIKSSHSTGDARRPQPPRRRARAVMNIPQCPCCNNPWQKAAESFALSCEACTETDGGVTGLDPSNMDPSVSPATSESHAPPLSHLSELTPLSCAQRRLF